MYSLVRDSLSVGWWNRSCRYQRSSWSVVQVLSQTRCSSSKVSGATTVPGVLGSLLFWFWALRYGKAGSSSSSSLRGREKKASQKPTVYSLAHIVNRAAFRKAPNDRVPRLWSWLIISSCKTNTVPTSQHLSTMQSPAARSAGRGGRIPVSPAATEVSFL